MMMLFENDTENCTVTFTEKQFEEIIELAMDCGLSVKELIMYRLFGYIED